MTYVVATLGSAGDLHPFLAVARALREQGHTVIMLSQEPHRVEVEAQGVRFMPILDTETHERTVQHPGLWHPINGFGVLWRHMVVPAIDPTFLILKDLCASSPTPVKVLASPMVIGARLARELLPIRLITAHTAPMGLRSCADPMFIGAWQVPTWIPKPIRTGLWHLIDHYKLEPMAAPKLNAWRLAHGLEKLNEPIFNRWIHSPDAVIGMFPPDFGKIPNDWPVNVSIYGFPLYESNTEETNFQDIELEKFSRAADLPLIVFFPGSAAQTASAAVQAVARKLAYHHQAKCLLLGNIPDITEINCLNRKRVSLSRILPRATVFVHHGGIGCCAQGLAASVCQVILPSAYDQYDNGERLRQLGKGYWISNIQNTPQLTKKLFTEITRALTYAPQSTALSSDLTVSRPNYPNAAVQAICEKLHNS